MARFRAVAEEDKAARRQSILDAAMRLFLENSRELPSVIRIADASGLAKGTVYLYFRTKEEIFLALLDEGFHSLLDTAASLLATDGLSPEQLVDGFVDRYLAFFRSRPHFLRLAAMTNSVIEQNLDPPVAVEFKLGLVHALRRAGELAEQRLPGLASGDGGRLLLRVYALTLGLWQMLDWPENVRTLLADDQFQVLRPDFFDELDQALRQLLRGALSR
ncbi:TetR family transcriptional regulator [Chitinivorax sp. PXF-14]|uniref:TetR/AcrR family transcriptional regulator n=1 Tax=Chitinivorax sp. PXF-14 TaxID=3230488 RepID=UPI00346538CF